MIARQLTRILACCVLVPALLLGLSAVLHAAPGPTAEQLAQVQAADAALKKAAKLYRFKKFAEAAEALDEAQTALDQLAAEAPKELTAQLNSQFAKARELLDAEQAKQPKKAAAKSAKPAAKSKNKASVSFTKQVAPLLVARCGNCHVRRAQGELSMGSYVSLSRGSKQGSVIMPGDAQGSRIIEVLESGDMPKGGNKLSAHEIKLIASWIDAGAKFDGPDSAAPLVSFLPADQQPQPNTKPAVTAALKFDKVQFARDVGPTFLAHCISCHGEQDPREGFSVATFNRLLKGGEGGPVVVPGKPEESLLIKKLRGQDGDRMPKDADALPEDVIARIEQWISIGARFDAADPNASLADSVALVAANNATHDQLRQTRVEVAAKNWRLILPDTAANREETDDFLLLGSVGPQTLAGVATRADEQAARLRKLFKIPADEPLIKGRMTLFVFDKRYDYGEVGTMLEHREIPTGSRGHWRFTGAEAYGCLLVSDDKLPSAGLLAQQIAGTYVASLGKIPHWFAEGTARAFAAKSDPKDPRVKLWDDSTARILRTVAEPDAFMSGDMATEEADILSYSFARFLMSSATRHAALMAALQQGTAFDQAIAKAYGGSPSELAAQWAARGTKRGR